MLHEPYQLIYIARCCPARIYYKARVQRADLRAAYARSLQPGLLYQCAGKVAFRPLEYAAGTGIVYGLLFAPALIVVRHFFVCAAVIVVQFKLRFYHYTFRRTVWAQPMPKRGLIHGFFYYCAVLGIYNGFQRIRRLPAVCAGVHSNRAAYRARYAGRPFKAHQAPLHALLCHCRIACTRTCDYRAAAALNVRHFLAYAHNYRVKPFIAYQKICAVAYNVMLYASRLYQAHKLSSMLRRVRLGQYAHAAARFEGGVLRHRHILLCTERIKHPF